MSVVTGVCAAMLIVAGALCLVRLVRPGSIADRVVGLDSLLIVIVSGIAVDAAAGRSGTFLDLLVVGTLIAFAGTVTVARFVEQRGAR